MSGSGRGNPLQATTWSFDTSLYGPEPSTTIREK
jgi:hypothetical protein